MATAPDHFISPEEFLKLERASLEKHEYADGHMFAMAGASLNHRRSAAPDFLPRPKK